ncbi:MAG TPA: WD40 repeat domain-containing protein [Schlesneria sp.]
MAVEGEVGTLEPESNLFGAKLVQYGTLISRDGTVSHFSHSARGTKGSGGERMRPEQLQQLDKLLSKLPEDGARLPVADRRLFVEKTDGSGQSIARVYDRADLPDEILSIAKFCQAAIGVWIPEFKAETEIDARQFEHGGFFCLSPDGKQLILTSANGPIQFWDPLTHKSLGEIQPVQGTPLDGIAYSPDGTQAALFGRGECALVDTKKWQRIKSFAGPLIDRTRIQFSEPRFTPDGKYLTLQSSEPPLRVHKASTWEQVTNVPDVQENGSSDYLGG